MIAACVLLFAAVPAAQSQPLISNYQPSFGKLRDTLFVLDSTFLEVRIDQQAIYQHFRSGRVDRFLCSTGNPRLEDGIATRPGIYAVQWKAKKYLSQQFDVYLNYWMPFDGGIGFHGLQGHSYYRHLGRTASSHGCVRVSNETGAKLFESTGRGTLVYVHAGNPARIVVFGDSALPRVQVLHDVSVDLFARRLDAVTNGHLGDSVLTGRIALAARTHFVGRIGVGTIDPNFVAQRPIPLIDPWRPVLPPLERITAAPALSSPVLVGKPEDGGSFHKFDS